MATRKPHGPEPRIGTCKVIHNPRTKSDVTLCYVGRSAKHRNGWSFTKGGGRRSR